MATNISATDIRRQFAKVAKKVQEGESHLVMRHNKVMFALISGADYERFEKLNLIAEQLEMAQKKAMATPAKNVVVTLPPTMYKVEAVAEPVDNTPKVHCLACGENVVEGTHGACVKNEVEIPKVTAEEKGVVPTASEIEPVMADTLRKVGVEDNDFKRVVADSKGLFTGD